LRCELGLNGQFASAELIRTPGGNGKPIGDLSQPLVMKTNYTSFFRDITLGRGDVMQLQRGALSVSVDGSALLGQIKPLR
jgi:hypothetical protein